MQLGVVGILFKLKYIHLVAKGSHSSLAEEIV
jgi:hypothetical protein